MKKRLISTILALVMIVMLLSSSTLISSASAGIWFAYDSLCSPFVAGEKFGATSDLDRGYWQCGDRTIFTEYSTKPNQNSRYECQFITKKAGVAQLTMNYYNYVMTIEVLKSLADVPVDTEYTLSGSKGTEHKWSVHSPNKRNGNRDDQRGTADIKESNENVVTFTVTSAGNVIIDHQYIPEGKTEATVEYFAVKGVKGTPKCTAPDVIETVDGQILEYIELPQPDNNGKWVWDAEKNPLTTEISINGTTSAIAKFVPNNTRDYNNVSVEVSFSIDVEVDEEAFGETIKYYTYDDTAKAMVASEIKTEDAEMLYSVDDPITLGKAGETTWYYTPKNLIYNAKVTLLGDVNIILIDGSTTLLTRGLRGESGSSLSIYVTSLGDEQGTFTVSTPSGRNGTNNYDGGGWSSSGSGAENAVEIESLTINGGVVSFLPGNGGAGGAGGEISLGNHKYASSAAWGGCQGGSALIATNFTINAGSFKAVGGNGGAGGGSNSGSRDPASGGSGGWGVSIKNGGAITINVADDYDGTIYIASGLGGEGGYRWDKQGAAGNSPAAVNAEFSVSDALGVYVSDSEITVDEKGVVDGTRLAADKLSDVTKNRFLLVTASGSAQSNDTPAKGREVPTGDDATGTMKSGGNGVVLGIILAVIVIAALVGFVVLRNKKKAEALKEKPAETQPTDEEPFELEPVDDETTDEVK